MSNGNFQPGSKVTNSQNGLSGIVSEISEVWVMVVYDNGSVGWFLRLGSELVPKN